MTSPARSRVSAPTWGPVATEPEARAARPRRAAGAPAGAVLRAAARLRRAAADLGPDAIVGLVLLAGWTLLWIFFLVGILEPASSLRLVR
jgi:hypothetical protein